MSVRRHLATAWAPPRHCLNLVQLASRLLRATGKADPFVRHTTVRRLLVQVAVGLRNQLPQLVLVQLVRVRHHLHASGAQVKVGAFSTTKSGAPDNTFVARSVAQGVVHHKRLVSPPLHFFCFGENFWPPHH